MTEYEYIRDELEARKAELETRLTRIKSLNTLPLNQSSKERAMEINDGDVLTELEKEGRDELNAIDRCLRLMEQGEYGVCTDCGDSIPLKRLKAVPYTAFCVRCSQERERRLA